MLDMKLVRWSASQARRWMRARAQVYVRIEFIGMTCIWFW